MRWIPVPALLLATLVHGQCTLSGSGTFSWLVCGDPGIITVQLSGGTAPYHLETTSGILPQLDVQGHQSSIFQLDLDWGGHYPAGNSSLWSVTDAAGCTAQFVVYHENSLQSSAVVNRVLNCTAGTTDNHLQLGVGTACPASTYTYTIQSQGAPVATGQVGSLPLLGQNTFLLPPLPDGTYTLFLNDGYGQCGQFDHHDCWQPIEFTQVNIGTGDCGVNLRMRAALAGALPSGTLMSDALRAANLIPLLQPYSALGYAFVGSPTNVSMAPSLLTVTGSNAIVDWVVVELRSSVTIVAYSKPALLQRDGDVIDADGNAYLNFPVPPGAYQVAIRHRNHLGVMTYSLQNLTVDPAATLIDLRIPSTLMYGTGALVLKGSVLCLWPGDATFDGVVKYVGADNDRDPVLVAIGGITPTATLNNVYDRRDVNLDGVVKYSGSSNDRDVILQAIGGTVQTTTRTQQLP